MVCPSNCFQLKAALLDPAVEAGEAGEAGEADGDAPPPHADATTASTMVTAARPILRLDIPHSSVVFPALPALPVAR